MTFAQKLQMGKTGESVIAKWMNRRGFSVLPVYEIEQGKFKGPALYSVNAQLIAPDMLAFTPDGQARWIEAKTKSAFTWHRKSGTWQTGINLRHYLDYLKVQDLSPWPIVLMFLQLPGQAKDSPEGCPTGLFGDPLNVLRYNEHHRHEVEEPHMVYWNYDKLTFLAPLDEVLPSTNTSKEFAHNGN